jgi:hypothetical protein
VHTVEDSLRETGLGVLDARGASTGDVWAPHVVLIAPSAARDTDGLARLLAAMRAQRTRMAVALVLSDDPDHTDATTWTLTVDEDGSLHVPALGLDLRAQQVPADEAADFARRLADAARLGDRPMPPPTNTNPWDRYSDAAGALRIPAAAAGAVLPGAADLPALHLAESSPWMANSVLPLPRETYLERAATTAEDVDELAPETNDEIREEVEANVGDLDADLAEWYSETTTRPRVSVLGPMTVRAQGPLPVRNPRTQWHTEIVAYLATRPSGVSSEQYATDLWPNDSDPDLASKSKVRQSAMIVRKWLGKNPAGVDYLPPAMATGVRVVPHRELPARRRTVPASAATRPRARQGRHRGPVGGAAAGDRRTVQPASRGGLRMAGRHPATSHLRRGDRRRRAHRGDAPPCRRRTRARRGRRPGRP